MVRQVRLPSGETVPALGLGTWRMGEEARERAREVAAVRFALELGMTLVDTAEMYGEGGSEEMVGEALAEGALRDRAFLVSKVYPHNASRAGVLAACERSLKRLRTDRIDLYLLHWRGGVPLPETVAGFESLRRAGKIRQWGVSNFDVDDMEELLEAGGSACAANQVLYNVARRGPEHDLLPWLEARGIPLMAYSPVEQGRLPRGGALDAVANRLGATPFQAALAFALRRPDVIAIPKASDADHLRENRAALDLALRPEDLAAIDAEFPPPRRKQPLEMI
jgi:diketogulonate reductase-like aldo/keto reductase